MFDIGVVKASTKLTLGQSGRAWLTDVGGIAMHAKSPLQSKRNLASQSAFLPRE